MLEVTLMYESKDDYSESEWVFTDKNGKEIRRFSQPDMKAVFQAGYDYALKLDVDHPLKGQGIL